MTLDADDRIVFYYRGKKKTAAYKLFKKSLCERGHSLVEKYDEFLIDVYVLLDQPKSKHIALDWDNTVNVDQGFFKQAIGKWQRAGYSPFICSLRAPDKENLREICGILDQAKIPIYLTDGKPKRKFMRSLGVKVHLWVDDFYPGICSDSCQLLVENRIL